MLFLFINILCNTIGKSAALDKWASKGKMTGVQYPKGLLLTSMSLLG